MRLTDKSLSDHECREILSEITKMVIETYASPIRQGFERSSRMGQCGWDLINILRHHEIVVPGENNEQQKMEV